RVEPGEVESALVKDPHVARAVVVPRQAPSGGAMLVAYGILREGATAPTSQELREHLLQWIPEHMVPATYVALTAFPVTPNGKIDLSALPAPETSAGRELAPPTTET